MLLSRRARSKRLARSLVVLTVVASGFGTTSASATGDHPADTSLSTPGIGSGGTGDRVKLARTSALRAAVPAAAPRILIIGTGVERSLFPPTLRTVIDATGRDATDPHGYGTVAASVLLQLLPDARITSRAVGSYDAAYHLLKIDELAEALVHAHAKRSRYDLVLLAYPPQAALDPITHLIGHGNYGRFGNGMDMVVQALLTNPSGIHGIPAERALRDELLAGLNMQQRDAVERFANQTRHWSAVLDAVAKLDRTGVPIVSPAGDYTRTQGDKVVPLPTQSIFGLAAEESVITVGASYADGAIERVSPTSGRGPTLRLQPKPDLLAPSDVTAMLPKNAQLPWPDDSLRAVQMLSWARPGTTPTPCPSVQGLYRCVLQGSTMVSASVVAANLAASVAGGVPASSADRAALDNEVLRGLAWAQASSTAAHASEGTAQATAWEQGAGVFAGLKGLDPHNVPVALTRAHLGEVSFTKDGTLQIPLWSAGSPALASATITSLTGPDASGATRIEPFVDASRVRVQHHGTEVQLRAVAGRYQGGLYAGVLTLTPPAGDPVRLPLSLTQTLPLDYKASYAYNEFLARGIEGERVEDTSLLLFAGLPRNVGLFGTAFKNLTGKGFKQTGGDPMNNVIVRLGRTKNSFDGSAAASEHGTGRLPSVPPGFYKLHLLTDHRFEARQERGRDESIGIGLGTFGPEAAFAPGADLLVAAQPPCDGSPVEGPFSPGCHERAGSIDEPTGLCTASNNQTQVSFNFYCAPLSYAVPSAVVSRAVHLIEHDPVPARSEWKTCGVNLPTDGRQVDLASLTSNSADCSGSKTVPTSWSFDAGAAGCLGPTERAAYPNGHPTDVTARYSGAAVPGLIGRNFPVGILSYEVKLPDPNTYTTAALSLSYVAKNAIVGVRFLPGEDATYDSSNGLLVVDQSDIKVAPALARPSSEGSIFTEWAVMSANASRATLSLIVIPTSWVRPDLNPTKSIAEVQLCDVGLRVSTFAKANYGTATGSPPVQRFPVVDRDLLDQIDPKTSRVRPVHDGTRFTEAGAEHESLTMAVHIPKNTTTRADAAHRVLSPVGGPAYLQDARALSDGTSVLRPKLTTFDPGLGSTWIPCGTRPDLEEFDVERNKHAVGCKAYEEARAASQIVAELAPDVGTNGRFFGVLALDHADLKRVAGDVMVEVAPADDRGAFEARWAKAGSGYERRFPVSDFFEEAVPMTLSPLAGVLRILSNSNGKPTLHLDSFGVGGRTHRISSLLE